MIHSMDIYAFWHKVHFNTIIPPLIITNNIVSIRYAPNRTSTTHNHSSPLIRIIARPRIIRSQLRSRRWPTRSIILITRRLLPSPRLRRPSRRLRPPLRRIDLRGTLRRIVRGWHRGVRVVHWRWHGLHVVPLVGVCVVEDLRVLVRWFVDGALLSVEEPLLGVRLSSFAWRRGGEEEGDVRGGKPVVQDLCSVAFLHYLLLASSLRSAGWELRTANTRLPCIV